MPRRGNNTPKYGVQYINDELKKFDERTNRLKNLDLFVLDNSMRETTVGQLRGHTLEDKMAIYEEIKKVGFEYFVVESFNHQTRLGDLFLEKLLEKGEDTKGMVAFAEFIDSIGKDRMPKTEVLPVGLAKCKKYGIRNVILEMDLTYHGIDYRKFKLRQIKNLMRERLQWMKNELGQDAKAFINIRDFYDAMRKRPKRVLRFVRFLSRLSPSIRPFALLVEESGRNLPERVGVWIQTVRHEMTRCGWEEGNFVVHCHEQWGMVDTVQLECLARGANGIWTGMPNEGAAMGAAGSTVTILNLIRLGNTKVQERWNCSYMREAAINITRLSTGKDPHPKQPVYGARSLDLVFGLGDASVTKFNFADFVGLKNEVRITTLASAEMILTKLKDCFGEDEQFTLQLASVMKEKLLENLRNGRKEEANSHVGLALLFDQSGGTLTEHMSEVVSKSNKMSVHIKTLVDELRERWNVWDTSDGANDGRISFHAFYNGFMAGYFGCYRCDETQKGLKAMDMDSDGFVDWKEFEVYLKWAGRQYPETVTSEELLDVAFRKGLIPAMQDVLTSQAECCMADSGSDTDGESSDDDY